MARPRNLKKILMLRLGSGYYWEVGRSENFDSLRGCGLLLKKTKKTKTKLDGEEMWLTVKAVELLLKLLLNYTLTLFLN